MDSHRVLGSKVTTVTRTTVNRNSTTGVTGVSKTKRGYYRAYITFRRKQYHLGEYADLKSAADARKSGEEAIYGDFVAWYAENYPEEWKKIQHKEESEK